MAMHLWEATNPRLVVVDPVLRDGDGLALARIAKPYAADELGVPLVATPFATDDLLAQIE